MLFSKNKLFCDINPTCYAISLQKEIIKRHIKNFLSKEKFAKKKSAEKLPVLINEFSCDLIKRAPGVDLTLQKNKVVNIDLAGSKINGIIIRPGEVFSFWKTVGKISKKRGYMDGRVIKGNRLIAGIGGGLCNLGNTVHRIVLHSPLTVTEFHKHSDALAPEEGEKIIFNAGTSVSYNYIDFKFKNTTNQNYQICIRCENEHLFAELRAENPLDCAYELVEENARFEKEGEKFYRKAQLYRNITDKESGELLNKELVWDIRSEVMYDHSLIPKEQIV